MAHRELGGNRPGVGDAHQNRLADARAIEHLFDLRQEVFDAAGGVDGEPTARLVAEREGDDAAASGERIDGRRHPFPAALYAGDHHDRNACPAIDDLHVSFSTACRS
jgi:hypothetical protein